MEIVEVPKALFETRDIILIFVPIIVSFMITLLLRHWDKKDNDARNLRAELREYFLTNCKPIINEIVKDQDQIYKKYVHLDSSISVYELQKHFNDNLTLILKLIQKFVPLLVFTKNLSNREYEKRFINYFGMISHIQRLFVGLMHPQIMSFQDIKSKESSFNQKLISSNIAKLITIIDLILAESELVLFNYNFGKDISVFQEFINELDRVVLETRLDPDGKFIYNREAFEKELLKMKKEFDN